MRPTEATAAPPSGICLRTRGASVYSSEKCRRRHFQNTGHFPWARSSTRRRRRFRILSVRAVISPACSILRRTYSGTVKRAGMTGSPACLKITSSAYSTRSPASETSAFCPTSLKTTMSPAESAAISRRRNSVKRAKRPWPVLISCFAASPLSIRGRRSACLFPASRHPLYLSGAGDRHGE